MRIVQNNTNFSVEVEAWTIADGTRKTDITHTTSGLEIRYWTDPNGAVTTLAPASQTSTGAWTSGGIVHKYRGTYRIDVPAINAAGKQVSVTMGGVSGVEFSVARVQLGNFDPASDKVNANVVEINDTAVTGTGVEGNLWRGA